MRLLDCTFLSRGQAEQLALAAHADVVGIYCMATMKDDALWFARRLRASTGLLVAGGPLPTCDPDAFLGDVDAVVRGEGEQTMVDAARRACRRRGTWRGAGESVPATAAQPLRRGPSRGTSTPSPSPPATCCPTRATSATDAGGTGCAVTTVMSTRGCPFACDFCSNVVFGASYRERSPRNVVDEVETALALGYDHISFADDVFTLRRARVVAICDELSAAACASPGSASAGWTPSTSRQHAGCGTPAGTTVFFGIESGSDEVLRLMNKRTTVAQSRDAVWAAHRAGLEVGAFFILCYPGETDATVLETLRFAGSLPLDYLGLSMPYPLPGTGLYDRTRDRLTRDSRPDGSFVLNQELTYVGDFSAAKMRFASPEGPGGVRDGGGSGVSPPPPCASREDLPKRSSDGFADGLAGGARRLRRERRHRLLDALP